MEIDFDKSGGLVPAIVQDAESRRVLMLGYMNEAALERTLETGLVTFYSRSRDALWTKGETSGHVLHLKEAFLDCDGDTLLILAEPVGPGVCHKGFQSCFYRKRQGNGWVQGEGATYNRDEVYR
jgi:phosphoribosyl-AMP cyclohydrolase